MALVIDDLLGTRQALRVRRVGAPGAFLELGPDPDDFCVLLPHAELDHDVQAGDELEVFLCLDSHDRPIATLRTPALRLHEVGFLEISDITRVGAFADWGLPKQLLIPFAEQTRELQRGELCAVGLIRDRSGRLAGTMRIRELLQEGGEFRVGEWVDGEAWREEPGVGVFVILERRFVGLLPEREPHDLRRGQASLFRISQVWPDGRVELSLRGLAHDELAADAARVLEQLREARGPVSDRSSAEEIRARFGLSRKAFKRAVGRLLKQGDVRLDADDNLVLTHERE